MIFLFYLSSGESQTLLAAAVERERAATEELLANKVQMSSMESQNSLLRQENSRFQAQLESEKNRLRKLEDENNRWVCFLNIILDSSWNFKSSLKNILFIFSFIALRTKNAYF